MKIILTNDDGYFASGIRASKEVVDELSKERPSEEIEGIIVAPDREQSAKGHGITMDAPLTPKHIEKDIIAIDGLPTDCAYLGINALVAPRPSLLVSGINIGSNLGEDASYSGTIAAAMEGVIQGVPSIAISQVMKKGLRASYDFSLAKLALKRLIEGILDGSFPLQRGELLNVNIPDCSISECRGFKVCNLGHRDYGSEYLERKNPRGGTYYWIGMTPVKNAPRKAPSFYKEEIISDVDAIDLDYISITPIMLDYTAYGSLGALERFSSGIKL